MPLYQIRIFNGKGKLIKTIPPEIAEKLFWERINKEEEERRINKGHCKTLSRKIIEKLNALYPQTEVYGE